MINNASIFNQRVYYKIRFFFLLGMICMKDFFIILDLTIFMCGLMHKVHRIERNYRNLNENKIQENRSYIIYHSAHKYGILAM